MKSDNDTTATKSERHIYAHEGGAPWIVARSADEAAKLYGEIEGDSKAGRTFIQIPDDEPFPMCFEDDIPKGLTGDCECPPKDIEEDNYCMNCGDRNQVTLTAGEWANMKGPGAPETIFYEYGN